LGYSDERHALPSLIENQIVIRNANPLAIGGQHSLFAMPALGFSEIKAEVRSTIEQRCEAAFIQSSKQDVSVYWVNLNDEAKLIRHLDRQSVEIKGDMSIDEKEEILLSFSTGGIKKLITKTSITAFGLNWQHCNHTTYFPTYSYEQYYQAIRRFWRFGQKRDVYVDLILSDGQIKIMETLIAKKDKANTMFQQLVLHSNSSYQEIKKDFTKKTDLPKFIKL